MNYSKEDYRELYNDHWQEKRGITWWEWLVVALFAVLLSLQWGCADSADAANIAQDEAQAHQRHVDLVRAVMDCDATVTQSVHTGIPLKQGCYVRGVVSRKK